MSEILLVASLVLLGTPFLLSRFGHRIAAAERTRLMAVSLAGGLVFLELDLVLTALPTVLRSFRLTGLASACERLVGHVLGGGPIVGWVVFAMALLLPVSAIVTSLRCRTRYRRLRADPWVGTHRPYGEHELVVLPSAEMVAISVPGRPGQVILSEGLLDTLAPAELDAVLRHEGAHLDLRHSRYLLLAAVVQCAVGWLPTVRGSVGSLRLSVEEWADAVAVRDLGTSRPVADALRSLVFASLFPHAASFSAAETIGERLEALEHGEPRKAPLARLAAYSLIALLWLGAGGSVATWLTHARGLVGMTPYCPL
ncbi:MAG: M48 family metalloprotease [Actinobacteria bacterium]|nr:M48 family metalloprotease [Actinomycetota bacterium]